MDKLVIEGGTPLRGEVRISGAKNAALPILFASLLHAGPNKIANLPKLVDIRTTFALLIELGVGIRKDAEGASIVDGSTLLSDTAPYDLVRKMRASTLCLGPILGRTGHARVSLPGGCAIGSRPIDQHLQGFEQLGAKIELTGGYIEATAPGGRLKGGRVIFDLVTVGGTENLLMAATLAEGKTILENCAREPEIIDLADALRSMGAHIRGDGTSVIEIEGVDALGAMDHTVMPDRIEAGTYMAAAALTHGDVLLQGARLRDLDAVMSKMAMAGVEVRREGSGLRVRHHGELHAVDVDTSPHPGFPTDLQAQFMALMARSSGSCTITENVFENRFMHVPELTRMGADIKTRGNTAFVRGVDELTGATVMATDLRASATLVIAGLAAKGTTEVLRIYHLDRGYETIEEKLAALGGKVERQSQ
ncbi:MAG: UDP-N-acetylglucosamine 1-carboxyvinyltransferase [Proteobacteria bacterium]|nr:UDP-N-acetylglucosamine 1-carboxyvinyltransferase [Pseudomonadota bacterium]